MKYCFLVNFEVWNFNGKSYWRCRSELRTEALQLGFNFSGERKYFENSNKQEISIFGASPKNRSK